MSDSEVRQQISREVKRALADRGLSARAAAQKMGVEPKTLYRWIKQEVTAPLDSLQLFTEHVGPISLRIGGQTKEAPPPAWVEGLYANLAREVRANREVIVATVARQTTRKALEDNEPLLTQIRDVLVRVERRLAE